MQLGFRIWVDSLPGSTSNLFNPMHVPTWSIHFKKNIDCTILKDLLKIDALDLFTFLKMSTLIGKLNSLLQIAYID